MKSVDAYNLRVLIHNWQSSIFSITWICWFCIGLSMFALNFDSIGAGVWTATPLASDRIGGSISLLTIGIDSFTTCDLDELTSLSKWLVGVFDEFLLSSSFVVPNLRDTASAIYNRRFKLQILHPWSLFVYFLFHLYDMLQLHMMKLTEKFTCSIVRIGAVYKFKVVPFPPNWISDSGAINCARDQDGCSLFQWHELQHTRRFWSRTSIISGILRQNDYFCFEDLCGTTNLYLHVKYVSYLSDFWHLTQRISLGTL